jgi:glycosyltransferase involved in cell wall biosynthesis
MAKPLVLHVAEFRNPAGGGFIAGIARLAQRRSEFVTALLCPDDRFRWVQMLRSLGARVYTAQTSLEVAATIARLRPAVVHAHFVSWSVPALLGGTAAGARIAWHLHSGIASLTQTGNAARRLKYAAAKRVVDRFYCVSPDLVAYLGRLGVRASQIVEIRNGVDLERFRPPSLSERAAARRRYALAPRERAVAFFGRDAFVKGADRLASALRAMQLPPRVIAVAASSETLNVLGGFETIDAGTLSDVRQALWAADAVALPSRSEGIAYSLLEARACGVTAVASTLPGIAGLLRADGGTELIDADDGATFAAALQRALERGAVPLPAEIAADVSLDRWVDALAGWYVAEDAA